MELSDEIMKEVKRYDDGNGCTRRQLVDNILILVSQQYSRVSASSAAPVVDQLHALLESYAEPCAGDCEHSQCPLLRDLHALRIKTALEQARVAVKPIVEKEREGESVGDLMNVRLDAAASTASTQDELVDEVQHRMDQVVEAAVEQHQAGREGGKWFEAAEKLGAAIDSLLELRSQPAFPEP